MGIDNTLDEDEEIIILLDEDAVEGENLTCDSSFDDIVSEDTEESIPDLNTEVELEEPAGIEFEDDNDVSEEIEYESDDESIGFLGTVGSKLLIGFGALIAVLAIGVGIFAMSKKTEVPDVDFSSVGNNLAEIGTIGETNIYAITSAEGQRLEELYEAVADYDYDEADQESGVTTVDITLTTILKDLKIKFVNTKNKLIGNIPFQVEVTLPNGKTETWVDEDKDGIIYMPEIAGGAYTVKLIQLEGYDNYYDFTQAKAGSVTVKTQLDYQKVDVKNEIKKATEEVTKKEDTKVNETTVESKLSDTVEYVMSQKVSNGTGYAEVSKDTIANPETTLKSKAEAALTRFFRLSSNKPVNMENDVSGGDTPPTCSHENTSIVNNGNGTHSKVCTVETCATVVSTDNCADTPKYDSIDGSHHKITCNECGSTISSSVECENTKKYVSIDSAHHKVVCDKCGNILVSSEACVWNSENKCTASGCTNTKPVVSVSSNISFSATSKSIALNSSDSITATLKASTDGTTFSDATNMTYTWELSDKDKEFVEITEGADKAKVIFKGKKAGKATLTCTAKNGKIGENEIGDTIGKVEITVTGSEVTLSHSGKKALFVGETLTLTGTATGGARNELKWDSSNKDVATFAASTDTKSCTVTAVAEGTATITVMSADDEAVKKEMTVVVVKDPKKDTATKLTDNSGNQVYVKDGDKYREATYADYFTATKFYTPTATSYVYNGWWTIDGKTYYFDKNGNKVTGDQVILGAKYSFNSDGSLKSGTGTFGIDVSVWNGTIDWSKVSKSGVNYAIIRLGFRGSSLGGLYSDNKFETNIKNATAAGVKVGVYFFTQAITEAEAVEEASMCLSMVEGYKLSYPIFIDVESSGGRADSLTKDQRTAIIQAFCKTVTNAGYKAGVYANKNWLTTKFDPTKLTSYTIWLAQYASAPSYTTTRYDIWQYSDGGSINGISGKVDLNLSYLGY